jgi:hypothetical protein
MDSVPFSIASITFLVGLALIAIALLGGGYEVREIKLPVLRIFPRLLSFVMGTVLVSLALFGRDILPPDGHRPTPTSQDPTPTPILAPTATLSASPILINAGQSSTLTWSSMNATGCSGANFTPNGTSGSMAVTPSDTTIYSITCAGAGGASPEARSTVTVMLPPTPTATLSASRRSIKAGETSTLTWSSTNATGCRGTNFTPNGTSGSMIVTPSDTTIYSITCAGAGGASPEARARMTVTGPTLWRQDDSVLSLVLQGNSVEIRYEEPTEFIKGTGVVSGDIKFKGKKHDLDYNGKAYIRSSDCTAAFEYDMSGSESADHKTIVLDGRPPRYDPATCGIKDYKGKFGRHLEFTRAYDLEAAGKLTTEHKNGTDSIH